LLLLLGTVKCSQLWCNVLGKICGSITSGPSDPPSPSFAAAAHACILLAPMLWSHSRLMDTVASRSDYTHQLVLAAGLVPSS